MRNLVDGKAIAASTPHDIQLAPGKHRITLVHDQLDIKDSFGVEIRAGAALRMNRDLRDQVKAKQRNATINRSEALMRGLAVVLALLVPIAAHAESDAERLYNEGQRAYEAQRYDDALTAWEKSYALSKLPALVFNIAQAQRLRRQPGDCTKASANYKQFVVTAKKSEQRDDGRGIHRRARAMRRGGSAAGCDPIACSRVNRIARDDVHAPPAEAPPSDGKGLRYAGYALGGAGVAVALTGRDFRHSRAAACE